MIDAKTDPQGALVANSAWPKEFEKLTAISIAFAFCFARSTPVKLCSEETLVLTVRDFAFLEAAEQERDSSGAQE